VLYANIDGFVPGKRTPGNLAELDRWILSELNQLVADVTRAMDGYNFTASVRRIEVFIDLLSNWYVRRSRRRFWKSESDDDKLAAHETLYRCLTVLCQLLAPIAPFVVEEIYRNLVLSVDVDAPESVHLTDYPVAVAAEIDPALNAHMELVMNLASLGRAARAKAGIKVRQPLSRAVIVVPEATEAAAVTALAEHIQDELNVKAVEVVRDAARIAGMEASAGDDRYSVAVVTELSDDLVAEGFARELVRRLQTMRRSAGLEISDHIVVYYQGSGVLEQVFASHGGYIGQETLSQGLLNQAPPESAFAQELKLDGHGLNVGIVKA